MSTPFALFRFNNELIQLTERQFNQAINDGILCKCNKCLACRAVVYHREVLRQPHKGALSGTSLNQ